MDRPVPRSRSHLEGGASRRDASAPGGPRTKGRARHRWAGLENADVVLGRGRAAARRSGYSAACSLGCYSPPNEVGARWPDDCWCSHDPPAHSLRRGAPLRAARRAWRAAWGGHSNDGAANADDGDGLLAHELGEDAVDMRATPVQLVAAGAAQDDLLADTFRQAISNHGFIDRFEARVAARAARELACGIG